jgi:hypothetical protein
VFLFYLKVGTTKPIDSTSREQMSIIVSKEMMKIKLVMASIQEI